MKEDSSNISREFVLYSFCTSLRTQGLDLFDIYSALILLSGAIPKDNFATLSEIQDKLRNNLIYKAQVNIPALQAFINRAEKKGYVERLTGPSISYRLTPSAIEHINVINQVMTDKESRINNFCENVSVFCNNRDLTISVDRVRNILISFMRKNINGLSQLIHTDNHSIIDAVSNSSPMQEKLLLEYINFVKERGDTDYITFKEMLYGSILSVVFGAESSDISIIESKHISPCQIYLDTNISFSIFDMHPNEESKSARQIFNLLKKSNFDIRVLDETVKEVIRVIGGYPEYYYYREEIKKKGIQNKDYPILGTSLGLYKHLYEEHNFTPKDAIKFAENTSKIFKEYDIKIEILSHEKRREYLYSGIEYEDIIRKRKPYQKPRSREHDVIAIAFIKDKRKQTAWKIEDAKAFFLTSDKILSEINYVEMGHKEDKSLCEIIHDRFLAGIFWLKDPKLDFPLETLMAANSRELQINKHVWDEFCNVILKLLDKGSISEDDLMNLFMNDLYLEDFLSMIKEDSISKRINDQEMIKFIGKVSIIKRVEAQINKEKMEEMRKEVMLSNITLDGYKKQTEEYREIFAALLEEKNREYEDQYSRDLSRSQTRSYFLISLIVIFVSFVGNIILLKGYIRIIVFFIITFLLIINIICKSANYWPWGDIKIYLKEVYKIKYKESINKNAIEEDVE